MSAPWYKNDARPEPVLIAGDPRLLARSAEVRAVDDIVLERGSRLAATLADFRARNGFGRAISAPQIGWMERVIAMNIGAGPFLIVNPVVTWRSDETFLVWDDCLSVPDVLVRVRRHQSISFTFRDHRFRLRHWNHLPRDLSELVQHEIDHLDGVLMTTRAEGDGAIQPMSRWSELVGADRPTGRLSLENIEEASALVDPVFRDSPQYDCEALSVTLGLATPVTLKVETANPIRSFKGRGASYFVSKALGTRDDVSRGFVCASAGNFGQALAYACRTAALPLVVFAAETANQLKIERMKALGADVRIEGHDFDAAKAAGRAWATSRGLPFIEDGRETAITEGAGTIGRELLARDDAFDAILVPLGNGALLNGVARWVKAASPATGIIGVCAEGAPAMERSWRSGPGGPIVETDEAPTIADGVAVRVPISEAVRDMHGLVDDVVLVSDDLTTRAMELIERHAGIIVEPAGALGIAAILGDKPRFAKRKLATILCGGNRRE